MRKPAFVCDQITSISGPTSRSGSVVPVNATPENTEVTSDEDQGI